MPPQLPLVQTSPVVQAVPSLQLVPLSAVQVPSAVAPFEAEHAWQDPAAPALTVPQRESQHTPSTQDPDWHHESRLQA